MPKGVEISASEVHRLLLGGEPLLLLDVREPAEFERARIEGARLLPLGDLDARLAELGEWKTGRVVAHCQHGGRSARACEILRQHRSPATPVVLARNLGREGEQVHVTTLGDLDPGAVDMLTVVLVGSSETRMVEHARGSGWVYTPRGYGDAAKAGEAR